ncbi:MAG TPA: LytTR family DNA-binding domain-containing protein [Bacillota bacterium]|nr:LytTR family DNA-binding domain-containing protein [Clostridiaceae bacterium]HNR04784.1 LytTR family DNA-binding domain-containing protein [Bacillota bacterium]HQO73063.1 LytTR family DNA-binding domain-containing protein [Sedimentibacter sp.]HNT02900.1 LytTR family DNA-binding domain-containing protein [Bacillota bacterium]HPA54471.1 LytTR family DNA-binding domain-containing protein [Bacillota bacterium]
MIKAILVDDELFALKELQLQLESLPNIQIIGSFTNPLESFFNITMLNPDVVFLDIDMPEVSGIYLAEQIMTTHPQVKIIFVTAFDKYAINAFELNAVDYILKPFTLERIKKTISRLEEKIEKNINTDIHSLSNQYKESVKKFFIYEQDNIILLNIKDIYYIEALNKFVRIRTKDRFYNSNHSLNYFENKLKNLDFFRTHRGYLVNLDKIAEIIPKINYSFDIRMTDTNDLIPVSRTNIKLLKQLLEL